MKNSAIIFDIGNVLVDWNPRYLFEGLIEGSEELEYFLNEIVPLSWHRSFDLGGSMAEGCRARAIQFPDHHDNIIAYEARWSETICGEIEGSIALLQALSAKGYDIFALSNFPAEQWLAFESDYCFTDLFKDKVISGREGIAKPDPQIFDLAISRFDIKPSETLFIDDRADNIFAATAKGMQTHQFSTPENLARYLVENNWLNASEVKCLK